MGKGKRGSVVDDFYEILKELPWWAGPIVAAIVFGGIQWGIPLLLEPGSGSTATEEQLAKGIQSFALPLVPLFASAAGLVVLLLWVSTLVQRRSNRQLFDRQRESSAFDLDWKEFEILLAEYFRRQGYQVEHTGSSSSDGGVDICLRNPSETVLVQCKHWGTRNVGVKPIRELLGVMVSEGATRGIVVTSGDFTLEASEFAGQNRIRLINGQELRGLIQATPSLGRPLPPKPASVPAPPPIAPSCPSCGSSMIKRTAKQGRHAGSQFWGCSRYPNCKGILPASLTV